MSVRMMALVFERYGFEAFEGAVPEDETGAASPAEVLLAQAMADHADDQGCNIYPGLTSLSRKARLSISSTRRYIKLMVAIGWLLRVKTGVGGRGLTNEYRINPEWIKGVNLTGFSERRKMYEQTGSVPPLEPQSEGSRASENPSTATAGIDSEKGVTVEPFPPETLSPVREKGVTAMAPKPSEPSNQNARAPARGSARPRGPEPEVERPRPTAEQILGAWRNRLAPIMAGEIALLLFNRRIPVDRNFLSWQGDLRRLFGQALDRVADEAANLEISRGTCSPAMRLNADNAALTAADGVAAQYALLLQVAA